jgi:hypothetical protein
MYIDVCESSSLCKLFDAGAKVGDDARKAGQSARYITDQRFHTHQTMIDTQTFINDNNNINNNIVKRYGNQHTH